MRIVIFFTILLVFISVSSFSQEFDKFNLDKSEIKRVSNLSFFALKVNDENFNVQSFNNCLKTPDLKTEDLGNLKKSVPLYANKNIYDNMPCLKPTSNHSTPVIVPDTSVKYTLLIKQIY